MTILAITGALGLVGTASGQPSTTDSDPEVGLPHDRVDVWSDSTDASDTYARQLGQGTYSTTVATDGSYTIDPQNGNTQQLTVNGNTTLNVGSVNLPKDGFSMNVLVTSTDGASLTWDSSVNWDGGTTPTNLDGGWAFLVGLRTYDGGTGWVANHQDTWQAGTTVLYDLGQYESQWNPSSSPDSGNSTSKNSDHLYMENGSDTDGDNVVLTNFTYNPSGSGFDFGNFDRVYVEWEASGSSGATASVESVGDSFQFSRAPPFNRQYETFDISNVSDRDYVSTTLRGENATLRVYRVAML